VPLTSQRRLSAGRTLRHGASRPYRAVEITGGEPHLVRDDLGAGTPGTVTAGGGRCGTRTGRPLLCLAHLTDLQLADVQSPARFEFLNRYCADPRYREIVPLQRPQEALTAHAVNAMLRTLNAATGPATGTAPQLAVTTGDAIDNAQWNELQAFLALFDGGLVAPGSGGPGYQGVQSLDWPDDIFWRPDGAGPGGPDVFRREFGFPHHPGLLELAVREFRAAGLRMPWLACFGNHEALNEGVGVLTPGVASAFVGGVKPFALPAGFDHDRVLELFVEHPEVFMTGPGLAISADPARRAITRRDFVTAHLRPGARPAGHGFTERNRLDGTAYYVYDTPAVRLVALDTSCPAGGAAGCLDAGQARWLEAQLAEVHSVYLAPDGSELHTGNEDRLVILFSHHGTTTLGNPRAHAGPRGEPAFGARELITLLHRFGNVVLWLNGHTHTNAVRAHQAPRARRAQRMRNPGTSSPRPPNPGFWEVTTCSVVDWPCQARIVELIDAGGYLSIVCTMLDHDSPPVPRVTSASADLAALHRELAANVPFAGADSPLAGTAADRNVELRLPLPFPLRRLEP
jgi:metallophosphoesterase (TIGR03767 family)